MLSAWESSENDPQQFPLLSADSFHSDLSRLSVVVSGPDGFGYYYGPFGSDTPQFGAFPWDSQYRFVNSHCGELTALWHFVERMSASRCLLLWVSNSQSVVYGVNKGTCRPEEGLAILSLILTRCDALSTVLLAFWVPRELNRVSDYLSHLSVLVRSDVTGSFTADSADALATAASGIVDNSVISALAHATSVDTRRVEQIMQSPSSRSSHRQGQYSPELHPSLCPRQSPCLSPLGDVRVDVPRSTCDAEFWQHSEPGNLPDCTPAGVRLAESTLALSGRANLSRLPNQSID